jgi:hypothetical protein
MIEETISKIEARLQTEGLDPDRRRELLDLLSTLKLEVTALAKTHGEQAAYEATRSEKNPRLLDLSLKGLNSSVEGFEKSHPRLVQIVNAISNTLSNLGI